MTYGTRTDHYPATSKLLHWLIALCVLTTAPVAIAMTRVGKGPTQDLLYNFHKSLGLTILSRALKGEQIYTDTGEKRRNDAIHRV